MHAQSLILIITSVFSFAFDAAFCTTILKDRTSVGIYSDLQTSMIEFSLAEIGHVLADANMDYQMVDKKDADILLLLASSSQVVAAEGFKLAHEGEKIQIEAKDEAGLMYGGLELAEQIKLFGLAHVKPITRNPYMKMRGTKFNIPLDVRTPSYTDASDVSQHNMAEMWKLDFWKDYIDQLAKYRYNFISCWSLHPFPSLVKVPKYPAVALEDVHRSKINWQEYYSLGAIGLDAPEIVGNYDIIHELTIDEKIEFWKEVMRYGKTRNIDFYFVTWNIFVNGAGGKYGITDDVNNETTRDYFRHSVATMFRTYPDLAGIGLTTGENMKGVSFEEKENWAFDTYARGVLEVAKEMPERTFTFIHRQHQADPAYIAQKFEPLTEQENVDFIYSFKYAKAHVFSATEQPYHEEFVQNIGDLKTIWTLRNDDAYYFRWGSPRFVREFINNIPYDVSRGMYYGSDQWIWGRDFTSRNPHVPNQLEIVKHWYHWMMWGRLSYDPKLDDQRFRAILNGRFPEVDAGKLFEAWHEASMIYPVTTGFHWGRVDFMWYIEGCRSRPHIAENETGFHDVNTFISFPVHDKSGNQTIPDFVKMQLAGETSELRSPLQVSAQLHQHATQATDLSNELDAMGDEELATTLHDIRTIALMGRYYAHKIAGSTYVALYRATRDKNYQQKSIDELTQALGFWEDYVAAAMEKNINPIWTNRVGIVDWKKTTELVANDIEIAKMD